MVTAAFLIPVFGWAQAKQTADPAALQGTVRDSRGTPVTSATVSLRAKDGTTELTVRTDSKGAYLFSEVPMGIYTLRAELSGQGEVTIADLTLAAKRGKNLDLILQSAKVTGTQPSALGAPEFSDEAQFTVAGVTDTTNLGGHGSGIAVRTRETMAKETATLGKNGPPGAQPATPAATEKSMRDTLEHTPEDFDANHRLGKLLVESGRARDAIPYLEHASHLKPDDYENAYELALANANAGNYESARANAQALLVRHDKAELHHLLGDAEEKLGDSLAAVHEYQRAAELSPTESYVFDWGAELLIHHAPEPALEVFTKGSHLFPRSVRMLVGEGAAWYGRGAGDEAVKRLCAASDLNPNDPTPYLFLGMIQSAESMPSNEVAERLARFAKLQPENAQANYYYAMSLWKRRKGPQDSGDLSQVESLLSKAIHLDPQFGAAYLQLGTLYAERRDYPKAISAYQQAIRATPEMEEAHYRLAQVYRQTGETDNAKAELRLYDQLSRKSAQKIEQERHEIRQFVYTLRDPPTPPRPQ